MPSLLLSFLAADLLVGVADALALVGLRPAETADFRCDLTDQPLVHAFHPDRRRALAGDLDAFRDRIDDRVRIPERQLQVLALHGCAVAGAGDLHRLLEAGGHTFHHAGEQRTSGAPHHARLALLGAWLHRDVVAL